MVENDFSINDAPTMRPVSASGGGRRLVAGDTILGRYAVVRELGEGGMGVVYQCLDTVGGVEVAVKCLPPEVSRNEEEMEDIRANYQIVRRLRHPNIAGVATLEKDPDTNDYYLVMDLAVGVTLKRWARRHPEAGLDAKLAILRQVAAALDYAHAEKVIHRDVKPENVMVDDEGRVKVLDFGLAAQIRSSQSRTSNTVTSKGGTPGYKSPEQWLGRPQQAPADVYAFGVMAYWMLSGHLPFDGDDPVVLGHAVLSAPVEPILDLPAHMNAALVKALAKKPNERFASCGAFMDALEGKAFSRVEHVERVETVGSRVPRSRTTAKILLAAALGLAVIGGWWCYRQEQAHEHTRIAAEAARQKAAAEESKRKAEEAARQKAAEESARRKAEEAARQQAAAAEAKRKAEEAVRLAAERKEAAEIRIEAKVLQARVTRLSDADGFKLRKDTLEETFTRAEALFDEKMKRWAEAAQGFSNYVMRAEELVRLDGDRHAAEKSKTQAQNAFRSAEAAGAKTYAVTRWNAAVEIWNRADAEFGRMEFSAAGGTFASAAKQFETCIGEAKNEKERREAEARERAEKEARERERRAKWHKQGEAFTVNDPYGLNMTMKWCPAGSFMMGSPPSEEGRGASETQHQVTITKGFWMGETEVTQGQWKQLMDGETVVELARKAVMDDSEYMLNGKKQTIRELFKKSKSDKLFCSESDQVPVYWVCWYDAVRFCQRLTQRELAAGRIPDGYEYRLPTEAEWEYACRAGTSSALPNGKDIHILGNGNAPALDDIAWHEGNSHPGKDYKGNIWGVKSPDGKIKAFVPQKVKGKCANRWGLYDMIGNVFEWCGDCAGDYSSGAVTDPTGVVSGMTRIFRGGSWRGNVSYCRSASRVWMQPEFRTFTLGFRVALAPSH